MMRFWPFLIMLLTLCSVAQPSLAQRYLAPDEIVAALDDHLLAIDTGFSGSNVLLFGATEGEGDVIVIVRGPNETSTVRKKDRIMGVWANKEQVDFVNTPTFYRIASSSRVEDLLPPAMRQRLELGPQNIQPHIADLYADIDEATQETFWQALLRTKERTDLYGVADKPVQFLGKRLFRVEIDFPANIPVGKYLVHIYLVKDKDIVSTQITPLFVSKIGVEAAIYDFAHKYSFAYGLFAVVIALFSGWIASVVFRKK